MGSRSGTDLSWSWFGDLRGREEETQNMLLDGVYTVYGIGTVHIHSAALLTFAYPFLVVCSAVRRVVFT